MDTEHCTESLVSLRHVGKLQQRSSKGFLVYFAKQGRSALGISSLVFVYIIQLYTKIEKISLPL